jgi:hypothetical protein
MKEISLDGVEISHEGKSAKGLIEFDAKEFSADSPELHRIVKDELAKRFDFKASNLKINVTDGCSDTFTAVAE